MIQAELVYRKALGLWEVMPKYFTGMFRLQALFRKYLPSWGHVPAVPFILPAMTDFTIMVENSSYMFVTGPNVVKTVTNEEVTSEELGGASTHSIKSGVTHLTAPNDMECIEHVKKLLSYMPQNCEDVVPKIPYTPVDETREILETIVPESANQPYDMRICN
jgi:acetyl-CoA carboxylase carboxyltransferase component